MKDKKVSYKQYYVKGPYKTKYRRGMTKLEFKILWTLIWFIFVGGLCVFFNTMGPLWLMIIWFLFVV